MITFLKKVINFPPKLTIHLQSVNLKLTVPWYLSCISNCVYILKLQIYLCLLLYLWNGCDSQKSDYEMSAAVPLLRVMSKFWIYLSHDVELFRIKHPPTISSFHSFLIWASRRVQTGEALNLKENIFFTFCMIWYFLTTLITDGLVYAGKFDALTNINALANFGLRGAVHHGRGEGGGGGGGGGLIKRRTIIPP